MRPQGSRLCAFLAAILVTSGTYAAPDSEPGSREGSPPLRIREIWVPEDELLELQKDQPDGVVVSLEEYRQLVLAGLPERERAKSPLPPHSSVLRTAEHIGRVRGKTVRFTSRLTTLVLHESPETGGWVQCPLSPLPGSIGSVRVDGKPGWLVRGKEASGFVLVHGTGEHTVELEFTLPKEENEDRSKISGVVPRAQSARVTLEVDGRAEAQASPPFLRSETIDEDDGDAPPRTRFVIAIGSGTQFEVDWRRRRSQGENDALISASHAIDVLPRRSAPAFDARTRVTISRRKTDVLELVEAAGTRVVSLSGAQVHSWERTDSGLRILLNSAMTGAVDLELSGVLSGTEITVRGLPATRFELGVPAIEGAYSNSGLIAIRAPSPDYLDAEILASLTELSPVDVSEFSGRELTRVYSFPSSDARLRLTTREHEATFETTSACLVRVLESGVQLEALFEVNVERGRVYRHEVAIPQPWNFESFEALPTTDGSRLAVRHELVEENGARRLDLDLSRASASGRPLTFRLRLRHGDFEPDISWTERPLGFAIPIVNGARRSRVDVGVALAKSMYAVFPEIDRWNVLSREGLALVGLEDHGLAAGLTATTSDAEPSLPPLSLTLRHHRPQGEFQAVTHLLALGERVRVRTDVKLAIVDRAIDTLRLTLPVAAGQLVLVPGDGIREVTSSATNATTGAGEVSSVRVVRYAKPWVGARTFRVEYEVEFADLPKVDPGARVPWIEIDDGTEVDGDAAPLRATRFQGESSIVFQSLGPVKIEVDIGDELVGADIDEIPEIGEAWSEGRRIFGFRFRAASGTRLPLGRAPARFRLVEFDRAQSVDIIVRELELITVLDAQGTSRTRAELLLAYGRGWQHLDVRLDPSAQLITVSIDDRTESRVSSRGGGGRWKIPLPPRSYARIVIVYERGPIEGSPLASWGTWRESAPEFTDVPVVETTWTLYHPRGFRFFLDEGNLESKTPSLEARDRSFLAELFGRLGAGEWPISSGEAMLEEMRTFARDRSASARSTSDRQPDSTSLSQARQIDDQLRPAQVVARDLGTTTGETSSDMLLELLPLGYVVSTRKLGGSAVLELSYRRLGWWRFANHSIFLLTILGGLVVAIGCGRRRFWAYSIATFVSLSVITDVLAWSTGWESPFLWVPLCKGMFAMLLVGGAYELARWFGKLVGRRQGTAPASSLLGLGLLPLILLGAAGSTSVADEKGPAVAEDQAIITYDPMSFPWIRAEENKVFLPNDTFRKLWARANPEDVDTSAKPIVDHVLGNISYFLEPVDDTYTLVADADVRVFTKDWVTIDLPFSKSQVSRLTLDGVETGVSQSKGTARITLRGTGHRRLRIELRGAVDRQPGSYRVASNLLLGSATRVGAKLPAGAKPSSPTAVGGLLVTMKVDHVLVELHLAPGTPLDLSWTFPSQKGEQGSRVESVSYSDLALTLDGYDVTRQERVSITGRPTDSLEYEVVGAWSVRNVQASELTEWTVTEKDGSTRLELFFSRPIAASEILIEGWAALGDAPTDPGRPVASLGLIGAIRQTSYFGLRHGARRQWDSSALSPRQTSPEPLTRAFSLAAANPPARVYEFHGAVESAIVAAAPVTGTSDLTTNAVLVVGTSDATISARTRYRTAGNSSGSVGTGPVRQEIELPANWEIRSVNGPNVRDWETLTSAEGTRLVIEFLARATTGAEVVWTAQTRYASAPASFTVPTLRTTTSPAARSESITWAVAAADSLEARLDPASTGVQIVPRDASREWAKLPPHSSYVFDLRTTGAQPQYAISLAVTEPAAKVSALAVLFARAAEDFVLINSQIVFRVSAGSADRFRIKVPVEATDVRLVARNQKSLVTLPDGTLELSLMSNAIGEQNVLLSYRLPRSSSAVLLRPFALAVNTSPLSDVAFWVGVVDSEQTETRARQTGLEETPAIELPFLPGGVATDSLRHTYRATRADWTLQLDAETLRRGEAVAAWIDLVDLVTVLGIDGTLRTEANYTVRNRDLQFLRVRLPADAQLWRATVDGKAVIASQAAGILQIPLKQLGEADLDLVVGLVYEQAKLDMPSLWTGLDLRAPQLLGSDDEKARDISVNRTLWRFELPEGYSASLSGGNVNQVVSSIEFASKVDTNLREVERLTNLLEEDRSTQTRRRSSSRLNRRQRLALESNLKKLQQQLGDNVMDLRQTNDAADQIARDQQLEGVVEQQKAEASGRLAEALRAQRRLAGAIEETEEKEDDERSAAEQAFADQSGFLDNDWIDNRRRPKSALLPEAGTGVDLFELVEGKRLHRVPDRGVGAWAESEIDTARPQSVSGGGLAPIESTRDAGVSPALETPPAPRGTRSLSFRTTGGEAEIRLRIERVGVSSRFGSLAALFAVAITWYVLLRRRSS